MCAVLEERLTPFGQIEIRIDDVPIPYVAVDWSDPRWPDLDGWFFITIPFEPDGAPHTIACIIRACAQEVKSCIESGENLELQSFFKESVKLSIGTEGECVTDFYDYDVEYLKNGMVYRILPRTKTSRFVFGIAWMNKYNNDNQYQTWIAADPTMIKAKLPHEPDSINMDKMTEVQLHEKLERGFADAEKGNVHDAAEVFAQYREKRE